MTITVVVRATGDHAAPVDIECNVEDESGLAHESAMTLVRAALEKVLSDNFPDDPTADDEGVRRG